MQISAPVSDFQVINTMNDPADWSVAQFVQEFCTMEGSRRLRNDSVKLPNNLKEQLCYYEVDGKQLSNPLDTQSLCCRYIISITLVSYCSGGTVNDHRRPIQTIFPHHRRTVTDKHVNLRRIWASISADRLHRARYCYPLVAPFSVGST